MLASDRAYASLRDDILNWRIAPGTALSETELALRLGISRTPLRSALARLALEGLVDTSRGRTGVVPDVSAESIAQQFEVREALELQSARLAARRRDPAIFHELVESFAHASTTLADGGTDAYYAVVARFDAAMDDAVGNPAMRAALASVRIHLVRARRLGHDNPERLLRAAAEHRLICEAVRDGDAELAASATAVHLRGSLTTITATLRVRAAAGQLTEDPTTPGQEGA
ncbi:MAG: GntR family transcriptional regulator [Acidobacteria bacterium]|nr:GntR family transcriptional regulator [Acidobacteriota bacterium]